MLGFVSVILSPWHRHPNRVAGVVCLSVVVLESWFREVQTSECRWGVGSHGYVVNAFALCAYNVWMNSFLFIARPWSAHFGCWPIVGIFVRRHSVMDTLMYLVSLMGWGGVRAAPSLCDLCSLSTQDWKIRKAQEQFYCNRVFLVRPCWNLDLTRCAGQRWSFQRRFLNCLPWHVGIRVAIAQSSLTS
jgi:hypothetical protein